MLKPEIQADTNGDIRDRKADTPRPSRKAFRSSVEIFVQPKESGTEKSNATPPKSGPMGSGGGM